MVVFHMVHAFFNCFIALLFDSETEINRIINYNKFGMGMQGKSKKENRLQKHSLFSGIAICLKFRQPLQDGAWNSGPAR